MDPEKLKAQLEPLSREFDLDFVALHGSVAKGKESRTSDIDLAVLARNPVDMIQLTYRVIAALGRDDVDISDLRTAGPTLSFSVARYGRPILERTPGSFLKFCSLAARKYYDAEKFRRARRELLNAFAKRGTS